MNKKSQTGLFGISFKVWIWIFMIAILFTALYFFLKYITSVW